MADGKLLAYYWETFTVLAEVADLLDIPHPDYSFPSEDEVENTAALYATLMFKDGSRLIVRSSLEVTTEIQERDYAYIYLDAAGNRIFQYDDAPHHPNLSTHPHHIHTGRRPDQGPDKALPLDIPRVNFVTILGKIAERVARG